MSRSTYRLVSCLLATGSLLLILGSGGCAKPQLIPTPTPTRTPRPVRQTITSVPTPALLALPPATLTSTTTVLPALTATPSATPTSTSTTTPPPVATEPAPAVSPTRAPTTTSPPATQVVTRAPQPTAVAPVPVATLPPRRGGSWDLEEGFYPWQSLHEGFTAYVANGWLPLSKTYDPAAPPRLNENKYWLNIHSGERSQEISFDWRSGEAGIFRTVDVAPGHRYVVEAWAKYVPSESGLGLYLGIDLGGGEDFTAGSVTWYPWRELTPNQWVVTQETVRAKGDRMTIFLRAVHPLAADGGNKPGGNTMFDDVSITDIGR